MPHIWMRHGSDLGQVLGSSIILSHVSAVSSSVELNIHIRILPQSQVQIKNICTSIHVPNTLLPPYKLHAIWDSSSRTRLSNQTGLGLNSCSSSLANLPNITHVFYLSDRYHPAYLKEVLGRRE